MHAAAIIKTLSAIAPLVAAWFGGCALLSVLSGWLLLSRKYPERVPKPHVTYQSCTLILNSARYNGCVRAGTDDEALHLRVFTIFSFLHSPLCIPRREIAAFTQLETGLFSRYQAELKTGDKLVFYKNPGRQFSEWWHKQESPR